MSILVPVSTYNLPVIRQLSIAFVKHSLMPKKTSFDAQETSKNLQKLQFLQTFQFSPENSSYHIQMTPLHSYLHTVTNIYIYHYYLPITSGSNLFFFSVNYYFELFATLLTLLRHIRYDMQIV